MPDNILVVEYEPRYTDRVRQALAGQPFTPWFAKDGDEAIRALDSQLPRLIVLSSIIPKTTTDAMIKAIREHAGLQQTPILLTVAGYTGKTPKQDAMRVGASDILAKPFSESEFLGKVHQILGVPAGGGLTSSEIFGDLLAEDKPVTTPTKRPMKPTDDIDKLLADTLGGNMPQRRPKTQPGTTGLDKMVQDTLSGLEKSARRSGAPVSSPAPPVAPPEKIPVASPVMLKTPEPIHEEPEPTDGVRFGQYVLLEKIATGGMAEVWKARKRGEEGFQKIVAIKKILPHLSEDRDFIEMFVDEAKLAAQLNHNNIIHIYDLGKIQSSYYIAMEYVDGHDLKTILKRGEERVQPLGVELSLFIASKIAAALDYAHRKRDFDEKEMSLVHRDVSPQNVLISIEGDIKLCDFGIAKAASKASHTQAGALKGKLQYMSPEQAWGHPIDRRADIFALATVLFEMLTGRKLFTGDNELSILEQVRTARAVPPSQFNDEVTPEIDRVVLKALQKEPSERYQTAGDMAKDIDAILYTFRPTPTAADLAIYMHRLATEAPVSPAIDHDETVLDVPPAAPIPALRRADSPVGPGTTGSGPHVVTPLPTPVPMPAWDAPPAIVPGAKKRSVVAPLVVVGVLVAGIVGGFLYVRSRNTAPSAPVTPQQQATAAPLTQTTAPATATLVPVPTETVATTSTALPPTVTATAPLLDPTLVNQEVQKRLAAERARLEQQRAQQTATVAPPPVSRPPVQVTQTTAPPVAPPPTATIAPATQTVAESRPEPAPVTDTTPAAPRIREGDLVPGGTEGLVPARVIRLGSVPYPAAAKMRKVEGTVLVSALVSEKGQVLDIRILRGSNAGVGLNEAAQQIVQRSTFAPPTVGGVRVKAWTTVPVNFKL